MLPCILVKVGMLAVFVALFLVAVWRLAMRLLPEPLSPDSHDAPTIGRYLRVAGAPHGCGPRGAPSRLPPQHRNA